jgi:hypothetical protein
MKNDSYINDAYDKVKILLDTETEKYRILSLKYRKNKKINGVLLEYNPPPVIVIYDIIMCLNFGDLNYHLKRIDGDNIEISTGVNVYFYMSKYIHIYIDIYINVYLYVSLCICICVYICLIFIFTHLEVIHILTFTIIFFRYRKKRKKSTCDHICSPYPFSRRFGR